MKVEVGKGKRIALPENPTTGFQWEVEHCDAGLECKPLPIRRAGSGIGSGGSREFEITASEAGELELRLALKRPWETGAREVRTYRVIAAPRD